jgi:hypothetical protein
MVKTRNVVIGLVVLMAAALGVSRYGGESGNKSGRTNEPMTLPRGQRSGDLNYMLVWKPTAEDGGPELVALSGAVNATTNRNPYHYSFAAPSGTTLRVTAKAVVGPGKQRGWLECAFFDRDGKLLAHGGPTDAINGCSVKATAP